MDIIESRVGRTSVLALSGGLDTSSAPALSARATELCVPGIRTILIDLAQVPHVTSAGFRSFIAISKHAEQAGIGMTLCGLKDLVHDLFEVSGLLGTFRIFPDRTAALAAIDQQGAS